MSRKLSKPFKKISIPRVLDASFSGRGVAGPFLKNTTVRQNRVDRNEAMGIIAGKRSGQKQLVGARPLTHSRRAASPDVRRTTSEATKQALEGASIFNS